MNAKSMDAAAAINVKRIRLFYQEGEVQEVTGTCHKAKETAGQRQLRLKGLKGFRRSEVAVFSTETKGLRQPDSRASAFAKVQGKNYVCDYVRDTFHLPIAHRQ